MTKLTTYFVVVNDVVSVDNLRIIKKNIVGIENLVMSKCNYHDYMPIKGLKTMLVFTVKNI